MRSLVPAGNIIFIRSFLFSYALDALSCATLVLFSLIFQNLRFFFI
nr:MAG TPA: hypothetical protein [Bacteriophage sp.]